MLELLEKQQSLTINQWKIFIAGLFLIMIDFFDFALIGFVLAELWPAQLRASGFGLVSGMSNLGKFLGPAGLAVIAGAANYVKPAATLNAIVPGCNCFAVWSLLAIVAFAFIGIETRGRTIEELDAALAQPVPVKIASR